MWTSSANSPRGLLHNSIILVQILQIEAMVLKVKDVLASEFVLNGSKDEG